MSFCNFTRRRFHKRGYPITEIGSDNTHTRIRFVFDRPLDLPGVMACRRAGDLWRENCVSGRYGRELKQFHYTCYFIPEHNVFQLDFDFLRVEDEVLEGAMWEVENHLFHHGSEANIQEVVICYGLIY